MNLAFALNSYNQAKVAKDMQKGDGYAAVKFALEQAIVSMEKLNSGVKRTSCGKGTFMHIFSSKMLGF